MGYPDIHAHLKTLESAGLLRRIQRSINKDTELHPLVRWQYRGLPEEERKAWLFENVTDSRGRSYKFPVVVGALAGNKEIYFLGMDCKSAEEMDERWKRALEQPIPPVVVTDAPCQEEIHMGEEVQREGFGLDEFPVPISTPGFDNGPYTTCSHWITKDPETGIQNIGNYRGQIKARDRVGVFPSGLGQDIFIHWKKAQAKGQPLPAALVLGAPPVVSYVSVQKVSYGVDEIA
ncbi:MAG: UbiD family decarboxylase, partial [Deltaproteobacteria bacterium]|nr:UbiD family decarboxylase [Deltaproteobacteria bacterium]